MVAGCLSSNASEDQGVTAGGFDPVNVPEESVDAFAATPTVNDARGFSDSREGRDSGAPRAQRATAHGMERGELGQAAHHATDGAGRNGGRHRVFH